MSRTIQIHLPDPLYRELQDAARMSLCGDIDVACSPEQFARECVEAILAERRLDRLERMAG